MQWYFAPLKKYATFDGRARRKEYWIFVLVNAAISGVLGAILKDSGLLMIPGIFSLLVVIPTVAVAVRRLHDVGKSGWFLLFGIIPLIGQILILLSLIKDSAPGDNKYGPNPKEQRRY